MKTFMSRRIYPLSLPFFVNTFFIVANILMFLATDEMLLVCDCHLIRIRNENDRNTQEQEQPAKATPRPPPIEREPAMDPRSISYERAHEHKVNIR